MIHIKRYLLLFMMVSLSLRCSFVYAVDYDHLLLKAQAAMFPKIMLLDREVVSKAIQQRYEIAIVYEEIDVLTAQSLQAMIRKKYQNKLGSYPLIVRIYPFQEVVQKPLATAYFVLQGTNENIKALSDWAAKQNRLLFSYDYREFQQDALLSVLLKEKTYVYMNKRAIAQYNIEFQPVFYKIVKLL